MTYKVALGFDNTGDLEDLAYQPRCPGLAEARRSVNGNGKIIGDGGYTAQLIYEGHKLPAWEELLEQFGLDEGALSSEVTITLPNNVDREFSNYNAIVEMPLIPIETNYSFGAFLTIRFNLKRVRAIAP